AEFRVVEWVLLAFVALPSFSSRRLDRYQLAHILVWLHFALGSVRHAPLFAIAMAPGFSQVLDGLPLASRELGRGRLSRSAWPWAACLAMTLAVLCGIPLGGFDPRTWPLDAMATLNRQPSDARLFHEQDWGGMIEAECRPARRAFVDDRFELFGKE